MVKLMDHAADDVCRVCGCRRDSHTNPDVVGRLGCPGGESEARCCSDFDPAPRPGGGHMGGIERRTDDVCRRCGRKYVMHTKMSTTDVVGCPAGGCALASQFDPAPAIAPVVAGVGADAPVVANAAGGRQSHCPYRTDLLPPLACLAVAKVLKHGADKYGAANWHAIPVADHVNHAMTHLFAALAGDATDDHLEHAACRLLMALDQKLAGRGESVK